MFLSPVPFEKSSSACPESACQTGTLLKRTSRHSPYPASIFGNTRIDFGCGRSHFAIRGGHVSLHVVSHTIADS